MKIQLDMLDYVVIAIYFAVVFFIAWSVTKKEKESSEDYFLAGRNLGWFAIGASLFASNIGSEHLIGLAGEGAASGFAVSQFEILAGLILIVLGWVFVPFYLKSGVTTMPEFLEKRYSKAARNYLSIVSVLAYIVTKISATIFAGAVVFEAIGLPFWLGAGSLVVVTGVYTLFGGLKAVIYTDTMQVFVMIFGAIMVTVIGINTLGGYSELQATLEPSFFSLWKDMSDPKFPWTGIVFGAPILGVWYWCTDQFIVQRVLSARNISHARKGTVFAGYIKMLPMFLFVLPGMVAFALSQKGILTLEKTDHALPALVAGVLPLGLKGLVVAGLFAALMSSLSSVFNSCSTLLTYDFYYQRNPRATEKELLRFGQISTAVLVVAGIAWIPLMKLIQGGLFTYLQSVQAYISPPIACVFLLGLFFKRLNAQGAIASLYTGLVLGVLRLVLEMNKPNLSGVLYYIADINFLHFAFILFVICSAVLVVVSMMTPAAESEVHYEKVQPTKEEARETKIDLMLTIGLVVVMGIIWIVFR